MTKARWRERDLDRKLDRDPGRTMPPRRRSLTSADRAVWADYARTIRQLKQLGLLQAEPAPEPVIPVAVTVPASTPVFAMPVAAPVLARRPAPLAINSDQADVDASTLNRFRGGKLSVQRTLDLHGRTAQHAFTVLQHFLRTAHADRVRCVEVITGRGSGERGGVIRREFPMWLNLPELRPLILAAAHPHPANPGSVRLLLRRIRG